MNHIMKIENWQTCRAGMQIILSLGKPYDETQVTWETLSQNLTIEEVKPSHLNTPLSISYYRFETLASHTIQVPIIAPPLEN